MFSGHVLVPRAEAAPFPHRLRWTYSTAKPLHASPAVLENHVYLTTEDGRAIKHGQSPLYVSSELT
jgi:hypothetical protein